MQNSYLSASIQELSIALKQGEISALQLTDIALNSINRSNKSLNAITWLYADEARHAAMTSDANRSKGKQAGRLEGIPLLVKDNIEVVDWPTTAGSAALRGIVASKDAPVITRLRNEGAIFLGKTAMHEFAAGITGASSLTGYTHNAFKSGYSAGGSSSGSAVAIAAGFAQAALGTDTAGSIRIPAAYNFVYGLRPTHNSVSMGGIVPLSPSQDTIGPITRHADDLRILYEIMANTTIFLSGEPLRIGILKSAFHSMPKSSQAQLLTALTQLEAEAVYPVSKNRFPEQASQANIINWEFAHALHLFLSNSNQTQFHTLSDIVAAEIHHPELDTILRHRAGHPGTSSSSYRQIQQVQQQFRQSLITFFARNQVNILAYPVICQPPVKHGEAQTGNNGLIAATSGLPALSLPVAKDDTGFPLGLELLALPHREDLLIDAAETWQRRNRNVISST